MKKKSIFDRNKKYSCRLFNDGKHFGVGIILEKNHLNTQLTFHLGWHYFKIWKCWYKWEEVGALARAIHHYESMIDELNKEPIKSLIGSKKMSVRLWNKISFAVLPQSKKNNKIKKR